jgi:hypothetical protein
MKASRLTVKETFVLRDSLYRDSNEDFEDYLFDMAVLKDHYTSLYQKKSNATFEFEENKEKTLAEISEKITFLELLFKGDIEGFAPHQPSTEQKYKTNTRTLNQIELPWHIALEEDVLIPLLEKFPQKPTYKEVINKIQSLVLNDHDIFEEIDSSQNVDRVFIKGKANPLLKKTIQNRVGILLKKLTK